METIKLEKMDTYEALNMLARELSGVKDTLSTLTADLFALAERMEREDLPDNQ